MVIIIIIIPAVTTFSAVTMVYIVFKSYAYISSHKIISGLKKFLMYKYQYDGLNDSTCTQLSIFDKKFKYHCKYIII